MGSAVSLSAQGLVESLAREASAQRDIPEAVAQYAAQATLRALASHRLGGAQLRGRCASYYWAVVRRRLVRAGGESSASARLVLSAVVEDLIHAGRDTSAVWREIERGWGHRVPPEVLEEYRLRLCA
jgi:hypothetical protein